MLELLPYACVFVMGFAAGAAWCAFGASPEDDIDDDTEDMDEN